MKKTLLWLLIVMLSVSMIATFSLAGCEKAGEAAEEAEEAEEEKAPVAAEEVEEEEVAAVTGQVVYNTYASDPEPRRVDEMVVSLFEEANPGIKVIHSIVNHEDFKQAIRAYLTSSAPPDVLSWFAGNRARFFIDKGQVKDISDLWESAGWNESIPKGFKALSTVDDKQYLLPTSYYWWAVYYNKAIFEQYNLTVPTSWDEFLTVCETLKDNGITPIAIGNKYRWTAAGWFDYLNMRINGPEFHINLMLGTEKYDDPKVKAVFMTWKDLIDKGYFIDDPTAYAWSEILPSMIAGESAMYLMGQFIMDSIPEENQADYDFFRFPIIDASVPIGEDAPTDCYFISEGSMNTEEAELLMAFLGSKEVSEIAVSELGRLVPSTEVDQSLYTPEQQKGADMLAGADYVAQFYDRDTTPEMADKGMTAFQAFWADTSEANIDAILAQLEADRAVFFAEEEEE